MELHEKERLKTLFIRNNINDESIDGMLDEIGKPAEEAADIESYIPKLRTQFEKAVISSPDFKSKHITPELEKELQKELNGVRGSVLTTLNMPVEIVTQILESNRNAKGDVNFAGAMRDAVTYVKNDKTQGDELTKKQLADLNDKFRQAESVISQKEAEIAELGKKTVYAEEKFQVKAHLLQAFSNLIPIVAANVDICRDAAFKDVRSKYYVDPSTGMLRDKVSKELVYETGTAKPLEIGKVMKSFLDGAGLLKQSYNNPEPIPVIKPMEKVKTDPMAFYKKNNFGS
jgi:hypothetical protein